MTAFDLSTYLINLDTSTTRLIAATQQLNREGLAFIRISAVDGRRLAAAQMAEYDRKATIRNFGRELHPGEIGCALSHLKALRQFVQSDRDYALILEDDVVLDERFAGTLESIMGWIESSGANAAVVNVGSRPRMACSPLQEIGAHTLVRAHYFPTSAVALLWTKKGARDYLSGNLKIVAPNDIQLRSWIGLSGRGFAVRPPIARPADQDSDIEKAADGGRDSMPRPLAYRVRNYRRKLYDKAVSIISFIRNRDKLLRDRA